jgi:hypothetical protein
MLIFYRVRSELAFTRYSRIQIPITCVESYRCSTVHYSDRQERDSVVLTMYKEDTEETKYCRKMDAATS